MGKEFLQNVWLKFKYTPEGEAIITTGPAVVGATAVALLIGAIATGEPTCKPGKSQPDLASSASGIPASPVCKIEGGFIQRGMDAAMKTCAAKNA